jgi:curved DNA-binding protein CbpA
MNFYEALNLSPSATPEEIEDAYRRLARQVHPDLNPEDAARAEARMKLLNQIRVTLTDPAKRAVYDAALKAAGSGNSKTPLPTDAPLSPQTSLFGGRRLWLWSGAALLVGAMAGTWAILRWVPPHTYVSEIQIASPEESSARPTGLPADQETKSAGRAPFSPAKPAMSRPKPAQVIQVGSSLEEVVALMGKPDRVEEIPSKGLRFLHYGKLVLTIRNGKMVSGEMKQ